MTPDDQQRRAEEEERGIREIVARAPRLTAAQTDYIRRLFSYRSPTRPEPQAEDENPT